MMETLQIGGLIFEIRRSDRRTTLGVTIDREGELVLQCPQATSEEVLTRWAASKLLWVHRKLAQKTSVFPKRLAPEFVTGESFSYLGRRYRLRIDRHEREALRFDGKEFILRADAMTPIAHFRAWFIYAGTPWLTERVAFYARRTAHRPQRVEVRELGFRWGSCGRDNVLYFNWKTLQLPVRLIDYVIVHELAHLGERRHTPDFWRAIDRIMPDWRERREVLAIQANDHMMLGTCVEGMRSRSRSGEPHTWSHEPKGVAS